MMRKKLVVLSACCVMLMGCGVIGGRHRRGPTQEDMTEMTKLLMQAMQVQMDRMQLRTQTLQLQLDKALATLAQYKDLGVVYVEVSPPDAKLLIDGGEYLDWLGEVKLPVGTHEFKAVWPDGKEAGQNVYVGQVRIELGDWRSTTSTDFNVKKTRVSLQKPSQ